MGEIVKKLSFALVFKLFYFCCKFEHFDGDPGSSGCEEWMDLESSNAAEVQI